jgi:hypothetical protein
MPPIHAHLLLIKIAPLNWVFQPGARPGRFELPACGFEVPYFPPLRIWGKAHFQGKMLCFPLSTFSQKRSRLSPASPSPQFCLAYAIWHMLFS